MAVIYFPEDDVHRRCSLMKKPYAVHERLSGVDRHLLHFLSKTELLSDQLCVHTLREQILAMKKQPTTTDNNRQQHPTTNNN